MTHPIPGDRVSLLGSFGTVEDVETVGLCGRRLCLVNFDDCPTHWCMAADLTVESDAMPCDVEPAV